MDLCGPKFHHERHHLHYHHNYWKFLPCKSDLVNFGGSGESLSVLSEHICTAILLKMAENDTWRFWGSCNCRRHRCSLPSLRGKSIGCPLPLRPESSGNCACPLLLNCSLLHLSTVHTLLYTPQFCTHRKSKRASGIWQFSSKRKCVLPRPPNCPWNNAVKDGCHTVNYKWVGKGFAPVF